MKGTYLRFYMHENRKHNHILLYEWLLEQDMIVFPVLVQDRKSVV